MDVQPQLKILVVIIKGQKLSIPSLGIHLIHCFHSNSLFFFRFSIEYTKYIFLLSFAIPAGLWIFSCSCLFGCSKMLRIEENGQMRIRCRRKKIPRKLQRERGIGTKSGKQFVDWNSQEKTEKKDRKILYHEMNHSTFPDSNNIQTWLWYYQYYIQKLYTYLKYKSIIQLSCVRSNKGWKRTKRYMYLLL